MSLEPLLEENSWTARRFLWLCLVIVSLSPSILHSIQRMVSWLGNTRSDFHLNFRNGRIHFHLPTGRKQRNLLVGLYSCLWWSRTESYQEANLLCSFVWLFHRLSCGKARRFWFLSSSCDFTRNIFDSLDFRPFVPHIGSGRINDFAFRAKGEAKAGPHASYNATFQGQTKSHHRKCATPFSLGFTLMRLKGILADPEIPRVPWEQITMGERIGKGASGLVTSGTWDA